MVRKESLPIELQPGLAELAGLLAEALARLGSEASAERGSDTGVTTDALYVLALNLAIAAARLGDEGRPFAQIGSAIADLGERIANPRPGQQVSDLQALVSSVSESLREALAR